MTWIRILGIGLIASGLPAQQIKFGTLPPGVLAERFAKVQKKNEDRLVQLREVFVAAGCTGGQYEEQKIRDSKLPNLVCTLPGSGTRTVIVTAHYDKAGSGEGAIDNWSGAALLPSFFESLRSEPRKLTFIFVACTDEEKGLYGSKDYASHIPKQKLSNIVANVNVDSVGLAGPVRVWASRADRALLESTAKVAAGMKIEVSAFNLDDYGFSDSFPFHDRKIPVIDFHSLTQPTVVFLHSREDVSAKLDPAAYFSAYRLVAGLLAYLDAIEPATEPVN